MQKYSCATLVLVFTLLTNWVLKLFPQLRGQVYYGVRVRVQVRAVLLAAGDPERAIGLEVDSVLVLCPIKQFIIPVKSSRYNFQLQNGGNLMLGQGQGLRCRSGP